MENASKALLIAASVLVVIILIAISVKVLNTSNSVDVALDTSSISSEAIQHNKVIERFVGENKSKEDIIEAVSTLFTYRSNSGHYVTIWDGTGEAMNEHKSFQKFINEDENPNQKYKLVIVSYDDNGFIDELKLSYQD